MLTIEEQRVLTFEEQRTPAEKTYDRTVKESVQRGLALLEERHGPDWVDYIDLGSLELSCGARCVLGQVYGDFEHGLDEIGVVDGDSGFYGFIPPNGIVPDCVSRWELLQEEWERVLKPRVSRG